MEQNGFRRLGVAGVLGGIAVFAFVLLKEWLVPTYGGPPPFSDSHGLAFHMLETVPMVLFVAGTYGALAWLHRSGRVLPATGALVALGGAGLAAVGHALEHVFFQVLHSQMGYGFMATYYLGWGLLAVGLTAVGVLDADGTLLDARSRALLVALVPLAVVVAALLGTFWFRSYADGFKLPVGVAVAALGYRLLQPSGSTETTSTITPSEVSRSPPE